MNRLESVEGLSLLKARLNAFQKQLILLSVSLHQDIQTDNEMVQLMDLTLEVLNKSKSTIKTQRDASMDNRRSVRELQLALKLSHRDKSRNPGDQSRRYSPSPSTQIRYVAPSLEGDLHDPGSRYELSKRHSRKKVVETPSSFDKAVNEFVEANLLKQSKSRKLMKEKEAYEDHMNKIKAGLENISKGEPTPRSQTTVLKNLTTLISSNSNLPVSQKYSVPNISPISTQNKIRHKSKSPCGGLRLDKSNQAFKYQTNEPGSSNLKVYSTHIRKLTENTLTGRESSKSRPAVGSETLLQKIAHLKELQEKRSQRPTSSQTITPRKTKNSFRFDASKNLPEEHLSVQQSYIKKKIERSSSKKIKNDGEKSSRHSVNRIKNEPSLKFDIFAKRNSMQTNLAFQESELSKKFEKYLGPIKKFPPNSTKSVSGIPIFPSNPALQSLKDQKERNSERESIDWKFKDQNELPTRGMPESDIVYKTTLNTLNHPSNKEDLAPSSFTQTPSQKPLGLSAWEQETTQQFYDSPELADYDSGTRQPSLAQTDPLSENFPQQDLPVPSFKKNN